MAIKNIHERIQPLSTKKDPPSHSEDGVDLTLIRWMLSLTPAERLRVLQSFVGSVFKVRNAQSRT